MFLIEVDENHIIDAEKITGVYKYEETVAVSMGYADSDVVVSKYYLRSFFNQLGALNDNVCFTTKLGNVNE